MWEGLKSIPKTIEKYPVLAAGASFWQPGLGQILCGKIKRGIAFLFPSIVLIINEILNYSILTTIISRYVLMMLLTVIHLIVRILSVYDAYQIASKLNHPLKNEVKPMHNIPEAIKEYPVLSAGASFWQPGLGQILTGRINRGIILIFPTFIMQILYELSVIIRFLDLFPIRFISLVSTSVWVLRSIIDLAVKIWAVYDSYRIATKLKIAPVKMEE